MKKITYTFIFLSIALLSFQFLNAQWKEASSGINQSPIRCFGLVNTTIFAGTDGQGLFYTVNNGKSWKAIDVALLTNYYIQALATSGNKIFAGTAGGVYLSSDN